MNDGVVFVLSPYPLSVNRAPIPACSPKHGFRFRVRKVIDKGSPEMRVLESVPVGSQGISKADLEAALGSDLVKVLCSLLAEL